jgi:hypothetical protein
MGKMQSYLLKLVVPLVHKRLKDLDLEELSNLKEYTILHD